MVQPFQTINQYTSNAIPDLSITLRNDHLLIDIGQWCDTLTNGVWGGGSGRCRKIINWKVPRFYYTDDPQESMRVQLQTWGYPLEETVGLQTAADLTIASIHEQKGDEFCLFCYTSAGINNAAKAGFVNETYSAYEFGTINTILVIDGKLSPAAMVNAIITATEAKTAVLQDLHVTDANGLLATGTTTDAIVLAVNQSNTFAHTHLFAGTATTIGNAIGQAVYHSVHEAVASQIEK